jgi:hypothetical protein
MPYCCRLFVGLVEPGFDQILEVDPGFTANSPTAFTGEKHNIMKIRLAPSMPSSRLFLSSALRGAYTWLALPPPAPLLGAGSFLPEDPLLFLSLISFRIFSSRFTSARWRMKRRS